MTEEKIKSHITQALSKLYAHESDLISIQAEEKTISAQLICYLKPYFISWNVDVEYNRDGEDTKKNSNEGRIFPDIIIHHRTPYREQKYSPENNLVAIEVKGHWNVENRQSDETKLRDMKRRYGYQYIFRIELDREMGKLVPVNLEEVG